MHLALHAAQGGPADVKALDDLGRGLARVSPDDWRSAADVAAELGALSAFAAGLRVHPTGEAVAAELGLPVASSVELELRTTSAPRESLFFARLGEVPGLGAKAAVVARKLWPTPAYLQTQGFVPPGPLGFLRALGLRIVSLAQRVVPALRAWRRARSRRPR